MGGLGGSALGAVVLALAVSPASAAVRDLPRPARARPIVVRLQFSRPLAEALGFVVAPGVTVRTPFRVVAGVPDRVLRVPYSIGPDGTYDERADSIRSVNGIPCGQECTRRSLRRWGYETVD